MEEERQNGGNVRDRLEVDPFVDPVQAVARRPVADRLARPEGWDEEAQVRRRARARLGPAAVDRFVAVESSVTRGGALVEGVAPRPEAAELDPRIRGDASDCLEQPSLAFCRLQPEREPKTDVELGLSGVIDGQSPACNAPTFRR